MTSERITIMSAFAIVALTTAVAAQKPSATRSTPSNPATVNQLMRGIFFVHSNTVFFAQAEDPAAVRPDAEGSRSTNPLTGVFGKWEAVENSALMLAEATKLLTMPRACSNGRPAPVNDPEWRRFAEDVRIASLKAYEAARAKSQDEILIASGDLTDGCTNCHRMYRESTMGSGVPASRCSKRAVGGAGK